MIEPLHELVAKLLEVGQRDGVQKILISSYDLMRYQCSVLLP